MNIRNFEEYIDKRILDRGYNYYQNGHILDLYEQQEGTYIFQIEGTSDYQVVVQLDNNEKIIYSYCDCPYDYGPMCKHEVSAYFKLQEHLKGEKQENKKRKKQTMEEVLNTLTKEQLIQLLLPVIKKNKTLEKKVLLKYGNLDSKQELQYLQGIVDTIVDKYIDGNDYLYPDEAKKLIEQLWKLVIHVEPYYEVEEKTILALDMLFLLLEQGIELYDFYYDDDGFLEEFINDLFCRIEILVAESLDYDKHIKDQIITKVLEKTNNDKYQGLLHYEIQLLQMVLIYGSDPTYRNLLYKKLQEQLEIADNHTKEKIIIMQFDLLQYHGTKKELEQYIERHIEISTFREMYFENLMKIQHYEQAIQIAIEGEEKAEWRPMELNKWKNLKYEAYKAKGDLKNQESLAREFLLQGNFDYYHDLKQIHKQDYQSFYIDLKEELREKKYSIFLHLIEQENDLEEIMNCIRKNPNTLLKYIDLVIPKYREEVLANYQWLIENKAFKANTRNMYKEVCNLIVDYRKHDNEQNVKLLIEKLKKENIRRRAFIDELNKIE